MSTGGFIHKIFCDISLEVDPEIWKDGKDSEKKNEERIKFLFEEFEETKFKAQLDKSKSTNKKNEGLAKALKEKANKSYCSGDNILALNLYNQALCFSSPAASTEYSIVLANRSALWFELSEHQLVESDVELAISGGYPENLQFKLYERRAKSRKALKKYKEAIKDAHDCIRLLELSNLDQNKRKQKLKEVKDLLKELEKHQKVDKTDKLQDPLTNGHLPEKSLVFKKPNKQFEAFSDAVSIRYEEGRGRFAVATRDIDIGELVAADTAFVCQIDKEFSKTNCWHCLRCTKCPVPCENCSGVVFCSVQCRKEANETYHNYECMFTDVLFQAQLGAWRLAYKAFTAYPFQFYKENLEKYLSRNEKMGFDSADNYSSKTLDSFHCLVTHDGDPSKGAPELMMQAHVTVFLIRMLHATNYFNQVQESDEKSYGDSRTISEDEIIAGRILHHFMRAAYYNTHETTQVEKTGNGWSDHKLERIGRVTNTSLALINHSCDPNYRRVANGKQTFGFACKPIRKGQEILDLYCKPFSSSPIEERQSNLQKYNFTCNCVPCKNNWPIYMALSSQLDGLHPNKYCQPENKINAQIKRIVRAEDSFNKQSHAENSTCHDIINSAVTVLEEHYKMLKPPHQTFVHWENQLHNALLNAYSGKVEKILSGRTVVTWPWGFSPM